MEIAGVGAIDHTPLCSCSVRADGVLVLETVDDPAAQQSLVAGQATCSSWTLVENEVKRAFKMCSEGVVEVSNTTDANATAVQTSFTVKA
jgi:hypothetical protein